MTIPKNDFPYESIADCPEYKAESGILAMMQLGEEAERNGIADMTLDEINAEIREARKYISNHSK